jgi:peroxiredoxin/outer membrane lipoprotein-sorting protein
VRRFAPVIPVFIAYLTAVCGQDTAFDPRVPIKALSEKCRNAKQYSFEGDLQLDGQKGERAGRTLTSAHVKLEIAPGGKYLLEISRPEKQEYLLISNGQKSWVYVPALKQYTEEESGAANVESETGDEEAAENPSDEERDLADAFSHLLIPVLGRMYSTAEALEVIGVSEARYEGEKVRWPSIRYISKPDERSGRDLVELTINPDTLAVARMAWTNMTKPNGEKLLLRTTIRFSSFQVGGPIDESDFVFTPPKKVKLVESVPIPGRSGSFLLNKPAPDFEAKTIDGEKLRLSDLRGKPVLLNFWASWCGPCRRELPGVEKVHQAFKDKGLVVLGVNDEGKAIARQYTGEASLSFNTVDDTNLKVHRLYRVRSIPSVFLIDKDGKIVRFFSGAHDEASLRAAMKTVGL